MPYLRPGAISYHVATKQVQHNYPCIEDNSAGVAIKQVEQSWTLGIANRAVIGVGEAFAIAHKGETQIPTSLLPGATRGAAVYIQPADNVLSLTGPASGTKIPFGRVTGIAGDRRGVPTGFVRIDMDQRDTIT